MRLRLHAKNATACSGFGRADLRLGTQDDLRRSLRDPYLGIDADAIEAIDWSHEFVLAVFHDACDPEMMTLDITVAEVVAHAWQGDSDCRVGVALCRVVFRAVERGDVTGCCGLLARNYLGACVYDYCELALACDL